jgi:hypothetical protein
MPNFGAPFDAPPSPKLDAQPSLFDASRTAARLFDAFPTTACHSEQNEESLLPS